MNILHNRQPIPRRTFLMGAGISLALPWLDPFLRDLGLQVTHSVEADKDDKP